MGHGRLSTFLDDVADLFCRQYGERAYTAIAFELNDTFAPVLAERMQHFADNPDADNIGVVNRKVDGVKAVMLENIEKILKMKMRIGMKEASVQKRLKKRKAKKEATKKENVSSAEEEDEDEETSDKSSSSEEEAKPPRKSLQGHQERLSPPRKSLQGIP